MHVEYTLFIVPAVDWKVHRPRCATLCPNYSKKDTEEERKNKEQVQQEIVLLPPQHAKHGKQSMLRLKTC